MTLATIPPPPADALELGPLTVHFYGIAIAVGVLVAVAFLRRRWAAAGGDPDLADRTTLWAVAAGLVGARLGHISTNLDRFVERPLAVFAVWEGGLVFFGGLLLGAVTAVWYVRRSGADLAAFADAAAPAIPLAHAIGRWGNYFNEELYGTPTDLPWALEVTHEPVTVHPTFLYESLGNLLLVGVLVWLHRGRRVASGALIFCYLMGYGVLRFLLELIRTDTEWRLLGLSRNAFNALLIILLGVAGTVWFTRRARRTEATVPESPQAGAATSAGDSGRDEASVGSGTERAPARPADDEAPARPADDEAPARPAGDEPASGDVSAESSDRGG